MLISMMGSMSLEHHRTSEKLHLGLMGLTFFVGFIDPEAGSLGLDLHCNGNSSARGSLAQALPWLISHL